VQTAESDGFPGASRPVLPSEFVDTVAITHRHSRAARPRWMVATTDIEYHVDALTMIGRLALPDGDERRPAVLIAHEGNGLDDLQKDRAARFAELGYVAFALDYHGGGTPLDDRDAMMMRIQALWENPERTRALAGAGLAVLLAERRADPAKVAAV